MNDSRTTASTMQTKGPKKVVRYLVAIVGLIAVIAVLAGIKFVQISSLIKFAQAAQKAGPPPESVSTAKANQDIWELTVHAVGTVNSAKGVMLSNDSPGLVSRLYFDSGAQVREGQVLVELDTSVERAQLASSRARAELAATNAARSRALVPNGVIPKSQLDSDEANLKGSSADIDALRAQIGRKVIRAPFTGRLGIRQVNLGQYLNSGAPIAILESTDSAFVDFTLPQQQLGNVSLGTVVRVTLGGVKEAPLEGRVTAIDPSVDAVTRQIKVRATVANGPGKLLPGMFTGVDVVLPDKETIVSVPATALVHASYGDSVFIVEDKRQDTGYVPTDPSGKPAKVARQQFVRVGVARGDFIAILDGVKPGQEVVTAGAFKLRNGAPVAINNELQPKPELNPHPENR
jgi:membrane fusion protein (multidrug efflux system)